MARVIHGKPIVARKARGEALVTYEPLSFWGGYDQLTGNIIDHRHPLHGRNASGKILVIPASRGSSTTTAVLLESVRNGTSPAAIVCSCADRFFALASIVAEEMYGKGFAVVCIDDGDLEQFLDGETLEVETSGDVRVVR